MGHVEYNINHVECNMTLVKLCWIQHKLCWMPCYPLRCRYESSEFLTWNMVHSTWIVLNYVELNMKHVERCTTRADAEIWNWTRLQNRIWIQHKLRQNSNQTSGSVALMLAHDANPGDILQFLVCCCSHDQPQNHCHANHVFGSTLPSWIGYGSNSGGFQGPCFPNHSLRARPQFKTKSVISVRTL